MGDSPHTHTHSEKVEAVEVIVAKALRVGVGVAAGLIALGLVLSELAVTPDKAAELVTAGLMVLVLTPVLRVVAALWVYVRERDYTYALFSLVVLTVLALGILIGRME